MAGSSVAGGGTQPSVSAASSAAGSTAEATPGSALRSAISGEAAKRPRSAVQ
jgi:hypothetical protein